MYSFENTDEARKVLARNDLVIDGRVLFLKVPWKYWREGYVHPSRYSKSRDGSGDGPSSHSRWPSSESHLDSKTHVDSIHRYTKRAEHSVVHDARGFEHQIPFQRRTPGGDAVLGVRYIAFGEEMAMRIPLVAPHSRFSTSHIDRPKKQHGGSTIQTPQSFTPYTSGNTTPQSKKGSKKNHKIKKSAARQSRGGDSYLAGAFLHDQESGSSGFASHLQSGGSSCETNRHDQPERSGKGPAYAWVAHTAAPVAVMTSPIVGSDFHQHDQGQNHHGKIMYAQHKNKSQVNPIPSTPVSDSENHSDNSKNNASFDVVHEKTLPEVTDTDLDEKMISSQAVEDVDESFQTAVETPPSVRSKTIPITVERKGDSESGTSQMESNDAAQHIGPSDQREDRMQAETSSKLVHQPHEPIPPSILDSKPPSSKEAKKRIMSKSGPSQTESFSPFARLVQQKKKDKSKSRKAKVNDIQPSTTGKQSVDLHTDGAESTSSTLESGEPVAPSTSESGSLSRSNGDEQDAAELRLEAQKSLLNRIIGGTADAFSSRVNIEATIIQSEPSDNPSTSDGKGFDTQESPFPGNERASSPSLDDPKVTTIVQNTSHDVAPFVDATNPSQLPGEGQCSAMEEGSQMHELDNAPGLVKKGGKKKKKSGKRKTSAKMDQQTGCPEQGVDSSAATLQAATLQTHMPVVSHAVSTEPALVRLRHSQESRFDEPIRDRFQWAGTPGNGSQQIFVTDTTSTGMMSTHLKKSTHGTTLYGPFEASEGEDPTSSASDENLRKSKQKMALLEHEERVRKLRAKGDSLGLEQEVKRWADVSLRPL